MRILRVVHTQAIIFLKSMSDPPLSRVIDYVGPWIPTCPQSKTSKSDIFISIQVKCLFYSVIRIEPHRHVS